MALLLVTRLVGVWSAPATRVATCSTTRSRESEELHHVHTSDQPDGLPPIMCIMSIRRQTTDARCQPERSPPRGSGHP